MTGIEAKDVDFLELENKVNKAAVDILTQYLSEKITREEATSALEMLGVYKTEAKKLLEKGLSSL